MNDFMEYLVSIYAGISMLVISDNIADYVCLHHEKYTKGEKFRYLVYPFLSIFVCILCLKF